MKIQKHTATRSPMGWGKGVIWKRECDLPQMFAHNVAVKYAWLAKNCFLFRFVSEIRAESEITMVRVRGKQLRQYKTNSLVDVFRPYIRLIHRTRIQARMKISQRKF